ncbi:cysteine hydrolase family protein [Falsiroseomonas tokyonensis]|uniref:Cysteine hydrolase family protein n=1 Tax=Falsiroseomonas tokyonensis TaxID=430521 RepID=A0ABV7C355_9PROT|nr:isochorismatase family cysteine hydrolase [Falsiroseomonas tokyonensis]MBU8541065.1 cysteine hydrolase [Falsiroseomonas tokyonensis]
MRFRRAEAALLLVDYQRGFLDPEGFVAAQGRDVSACAEAARQGSALARAARAVGMPVIWTRHVLRADHADGGLLTTELRPRLGELRALAAGSADVALPEEAGVQPGDVVLDKPRYSAFFGTALDVVLATRGIRALMVGGVTTSMCVESSVRDAAQRDLRCFVVRDAVADFDEARHAASLSAMQFGFARIIGANQAADAIAAGEAEFPLD